MRLEKPRISITFITITDLLFVELFELHIYKNLIESITNLTISFRYEDRHEVNNNLEFNNALDNKREY